MARYIFITGGVVSSLGKGLASAALGALLQARGFSVRLRKLDPYLNVDPGTMSPYQHGEVYVLDDGSETDLDLGHYERFTSGALTRDCPKPLLPVAGRPLRVTFLSPGQKPIQTTMDVPGFWASSYADVRKDMRGRYPKHPWPEDPREADPTLRAKPRK